MSRSELESAKAEILARAGTTSCLEVTEPGDTGIAYAYDEGIIVRHLADLSTSGPPTNWTSASR